MNHFFQFQGKSKRSLSIPQRIQLYRHLAGQLRNGIAITHSLKLFSCRSDPEGKKPDLRIQQVMRLIQDGKNLGSAFSGLIPTDEMLLLDYGEVSGNLPQILDLLQESRQQQLRLRQALREASTAPVVYLCSTLTMLWVIGAKVLPSLQTVLPMSKAHGTVAILYRLGEIAQNPWWAALVVLMVLLAARLVLKSLSQWRGAWRLKAEKFIPYSLYRDLQGYSWLIGFSTLLSSGVHDLQILRHQKQSANPWLKERLSHVILNLENGKTLGAALQSRAPYHGALFLFPNPDVIAEILSIDGHRDFAQRLGDLRSRWGGELDLRLQHLAKRFGFWMEILMFGCMGFLMVAINQLSLQVGNLRF